MYKEIISNSNLPEIANNFLVLVIDSHRFEIKKSTNQPNPKEPSPKINIGKLIIIPACKN